MKKLILSLTCLAAFVIHPCRGEPVVAVTSNNLLLFFDSATPGTISRSVAVSGLQGGEVLIGMDYRRSNGGLYAVSTNSRLYQLNESTGAATAIGSAGGFTISSLSGQIVGFNFDPISDRIRLVSVNQNIRIHPDTGVTSNVDTTLFYVPLDAHDGNQPGGVALAYTNNYLGAQTSLVYAIDSTYDVLDVVDPANTGHVHTLAPIGVNSGFRMGFDISGVTGTAYACLSVSNVPTFYSINLGTGVTTSFGRVATAVFLGSNTINAITVPSPTRVLNLATRGIVGGGNGVLIGGFIARGAANTKLAIRGIGPSLSAFFNNALANPRLEIFDGNGASVRVNDDWKNGSPEDQVGLVQSGLQPSNDLEAATIVTLAPGQYTAVVSSVDPNNSGVALVEIYQL